MQTIPEELTKLKRFVNCNNDSKVPTDGYSLRAVSISDPRSWCSFEQAASNVRNGYADYVGFVFADDGIVGIDIDQGYDEDGFMSDLAYDIIGACRSYTERSRSGRGFHIYVKGNIPFDGLNNGNGVEIYKNRRYFIMTGAVEVFHEVVENQDALNYVVDKYFSGQRNSKNEYRNERVYTPRWKPPVNGKFCVKPEYPIIPQGCRNTSLLSLGGALINEGLRDVEILAEMQKCNAVACEPPLSDEEVCAVWRSVMRYKSER